MKKIISRNKGIVVFIIGSLVSVLGCSLFESEEDAKVITMNDLPPAVKVLADKEVADCKIIEVEEEKKDGALIYAITYDQAGTIMEIEYKPDGTLISKGKE